VIWGFVGIITGLVWDDSGAQLSGARVEISGRARTESARSGGLGFFHFGDVPPGEYTLSVSHPDYATVEEKVVVRAGETTTVGVQLQHPKKKR
jgi:hypothetical protein